MIYVASKTKHAAMWKKFRDDGYSIDSTWIDEAGEGESADLSGLWRRCIDEASAAKALVLYAEEGDILKGAWIELGAALASGVRVFAVGIGKYTVAHDKRITHCATVDEAMCLAAALPYLQPPAVPDEYEPRIDERGADVGWAGVPTATPEATGDASSEGTSLNRAVMNCVDPIPTDALDFKEFASLSGRIANALAQARADEREACATEAEKYAAMMFKVAEAEDSSGDEWDAFGSREQALAASRIAAAIRARK